MPDNDFDALEAVKIGMSFEEAGHRFYSEAADITESPKGKKMFERLAHDELEHLELFRRARNSLLETGVWPEVTEKDLHAKIKTIGKPVFPKTATASSGATVSSRERHALRRGIQAEKDSIAFYSQAVTKTKDAAAKALFSKLVEVEEGHLMLLEAEFDYITKTGIYYGELEFSLEGPD